MMHKPIFIENLSLIFPHKACFADFTTTIYSGDLIAIIGQNGSGKSSLLKMLLGRIEPSFGRINISGSISFGYVPQIVDEINNLSGGELFNRALSDALSNNPDILLLDEPTNNLDRKNRNSLLKMIKNYRGTIIVVSHDVELLRSAFSSFWHIADGKISVFKGNYDDYIAEVGLKRQVLEDKLALLNGEKKRLHQSLMHEQSRAAKSKNVGKKNIQQRKWSRMAAGGLKSQGQNTTGRKKAELSENRDMVNEQLANLRLPEVIKPKFSLSSADIGNKIVVAVTDGAACYGERVVLNKALD